MKKIINLLIVTCLTMGILLTGCGSKNTTQADNSSKSSESKEIKKEDNKKYVIKLGHVLATDHPAHIAMENAAKRISEKTNGNIDLQIYPNGTLASYKDGVEAMLSGAPYMLYSSPGQFSDFVPDFVALQGPFLYDSYDMYNKLMDSQLIKDLISTAESKGIHPIAMNYLAGYRHILSDKEIKTVDNVKNLKIRIPKNKVWTEPFSAMGTNASPIDWNETYTALQQGVIDAVECSYGNLYNAKMYEQKKKLAETGHILDISGIFAGAQFWNTLPDEYRTIITQELVAGAYENNEASLKDEAEKKELLIQNGVVCNEVDKDTFKKATKSVVLQYDIGEKLLAELDKIREELNK